MARPDSWFRLNNAVVDHPKVQGLSGDLFKAWVNLLCVSSQNGGKLPPFSDIAFKLRVSETKVKSLLETLEKRFLFDRDETGGYVPHDWNDHQFKSDSSTPRVRAFRERKKETKDGVSGNENETAEETFRNAESETDHSITQQTITDQTPKAPKTGARYSDEFETWWAQYPEKVAKDAAWKAWQKAFKRVDLQTLIEAAKRYISNKPADVRWKHPATWLNGGCWQDAPATIDQPQAPVGPIIHTDAEWCAVIEAFQRTGNWPISGGYGTEYGMGGCAIPANLVVKYNLDGLSPPNFAMAG